MKHNKHSWQKLGNGLSFCVQCGCTKEDRLLRQLPNKSWIHGITYSLTGRDYKKAPPCISVMPLADNL